MKWWGYLYLGIVTIVMIYLSYRYMDLTLRVRRLKRRYDLLLRGRGDFNLEELLKAHSHDIDLSIRKLKMLESSYASMDMKVAENKEELDAKILELNSNTNTSLDSRLDEKFEFLDKKIGDKSQSLDKLISDNYNKHSSDILLNNKELKATIEKLEKELSIRVNNIDDKYNKEVVKLDNKYEDKIAKLDSKFLDEVNTINKDRALTYKKINEKHEFDVSDLRKNSQDNYEKLIKYIDDQDKKIDDNLGFAIQQVSLYKYNAFQNQTGDLSFTMVLLDRMNNGLMITSINARDASYTYSKEIVDGKCLVEISPEEEKALDKLVKKKHE